MTTMAQLAPALRAGQPTFSEDYTCRPSMDPTKGHRDDQPGLRGHSVGEEFPYRVVGKGDGTWEVHRCGCGQRLVGMSCRAAHRVARHLARRFRTTGKGDMVSTRLVGFGATLVVVDELASREVLGRAARDGGLVESYEKYIYKDKRL